MSGHDPWPRRSSTRAFTAALVVGLLLLPTPATAGRWDRLDHEGLYDLRWIGAARTYDGQEYHVRVRLAFWRHVATAELPEEWTTEVVFPGLYGGTFFMDLFARRGHIRAQWGEFGSHCCGRVRVVALSPRLLTFRMPVFGDPDTIEGVYVRTGPWEGGRRHWFSGGFRVIRDRIGSQDDLIAVSI